MIDNKIQEDGFPGGIGIGLDLPVGYINGAPTGSNSKLLTKIEEDEIFENFLNNYFTILEGTDDVWLDGFATVGKEHNDTWQDFDNPEQGYTDMLPGWNVQGHLSDSLPKSVKDRVLPKNNHFEENGEMKRVMHPSKGEAYAQEKKEKWEMNPFNRSDKTYEPDASYKEVNEGAPGVFQIYGIESGNHSIESLASVNNVSVEEIKNKITFGAQQEIERTNNTRLAVQIAKNNIAKDLHYYENRTKVLRNLRETDEPLDLKTQNINDFVLRSRIF
jgi:hypothetical protein